MKTIESYPKAFVINLQIIGLDIARSLARRGIPVVGLCLPSEIGLYSRYGEKVICPDWRASEKAFIDFLLDLGRKLPQQGVLFPTSDDTVMIVSKNRNLLGGYFKFAMPDRDLIEGVLNKDKLQKITEKYEIPAPKSYFPRSIAELEFIRKEIEYPCIIKPCYSQSWRRANMRDVVGSRKAVKIGSHTALFEEYKRINASLDGNTVMVQEYIEGGEDYGFASYLNSQSEPMALFAVRKLRNNPPEFGTGTLLESVYEPKIIELGLSLLKGIKYRGLSEIEFRRDPRSGEFKIIDFNPRHWQWHGFATGCGIDFSYIAYKDLINEKIDFDNGSCSRNNGVKWWLIEEDLYSSAKLMVEGKLNLTEWLKSLRGEKIYGIFAWDDPGPFIVSSLKLLLSTLRSILNKTILKPFLSIKRSDLGSKQSRSFR